MHVPSTMLSGKVCAVTTVLSLAALFSAFIMARKCDKAPSRSKFAALSAFVFAAQMLNYPVPGGTSVHFMGGFFLAALLGPSFGLLATSLVLFVQATLYADGGVSALGSNIMNMALVPALFASALPQAKKYMPEAFAMFCLSMGSVVFSMLSLSLELSASGSSPFTQVLVAMLASHAFLSIGEALLSVAACSIFGSYQQEKALFRFSIITGLMLLFLSPLASTLPGGISKASKLLSLLSASSDPLPVLFPNYQASFIQYAALSGIIAGFFGLLSSFFLAFYLSSLFQKKSS